ncbi:hypothetical protein Bbelb_215680 [Branchiostoma belcheri]|nr:hypothetical protein Bbelb_215680 [Branchiostoma belcheri]
MGLLVADLGTAPELICKAGKTDVRGGGSAPARFGEMCEPIPISFRGTCERPAGYNTSSFPNSFGHSSSLEIVQSPEYQSFFSVIRNISAFCYQDALTAFCRMFVPQCENGMQTQLCRSACEDINTRCLPDGSGSLLPCDVLPSQDDDPTCFAFRQPTSEMCEPMPESFRGTCEVYAGYNTSSFPNSFGHLSEQEVALSPEYQSFFSIQRNISAFCYQEAYTAFCRMFVPQCEDDMQTQLCRSACEDINTRCSPDGSGSLLPCDVLPFQDDDQTCFAIRQPTSEMCEPIPESFRGTCELLAGYKTSSFPNSFGHLSQQEVALSEEFRGFFSSIANISESASCYQDAYTAFCRMFVPQCENGTQIQLCRSACEDINTRCLPDGSTSPLPCDVLPSQDDDPTCSLIEQLPTECEPIRYSRCMVLPYSQTSFPNIVQWPNQDFALEFAPNPCRSLCNEINATCGDRALAAGVQWNAAICPQLSDDSCTRPNVPSIITSPATPSQQSNATATTAPTASQQTNTTATTAPTASQLANTTATDAPTSSQLANTTATDAPTTGSQQDNTPTVGASGGAMATGGNADIVIGVVAAIAWAVALGNSG